MTNDEKSKPVAAPPVGAESRGDDVLEALIEQFEMYLGDGVTESSQPRALRDAKDLLSRLREAAPSLSREAFEAGWNAGFQEALTPDLHPERNRCEDAFQAVRAAAQSAAPPSLVDVIARLKAEATTVPEGHESRERGASTFNWYGWFIRKLEAWAGPSSAS